MTEARFRNRIVGDGEVAPDALVANPANWRVHPRDQERALEAALDSVGWVQRIIINQRTGHIVDGHLRAALALRDHEPTVPVLYVDLAPDEEALTLASLDPLGAMAATDKDALAALLGGIAADSDPIRNLLQAVSEQTRVPFGAPAGIDPGPDSDRGAELRSQWQTERGQLWEIPSATYPGRAHRLLCGDATAADDVGRLMGEARAILFATDPPYAVEYDATNHAHKWNAPPERNNKDWSQQYRDFDVAAQGEPLYDAFIAAAIGGAIAPNAAWYCWHASRRQAMVERVWERHDAFVHQQIVWVKDRPILTRSHYMWQHEPCFFGWRKGHRPPRRADDYPSGVWQLPTIQAGIHTDHPTSKPVEVFALPMRQHTLPGEVCYEPFTGSGTQHVAAEQLGRLCFGLELEPEFVAVTLERLAGMGLEPRLV